MRRAVAFLVFVILAVGLSGVSALADAPRLVCLVAAVSGQASLSPADGPKKPLELFTRLREGERLELARGAEVQLAFLQLGQRETWTGPATVLIAAAGGQSPNASTPPVVDKLPGKPKPATGEASSILSQAGEQATAQVKTREVALPEDRPLSDEERAHLADFEGQVAEMRKTAAPGDVTPDIALLEEFTRLGQRRKALEEVRRLRQAYPDNAALAAFEE